MARKKASKPTQPAKPVKLHGKNLTPTLSDIVRKSAEDRKMSVGKFVKQYGEEIEKLAKANYIDFDVRTDEVYEYVADLNKRKITIDTGNGLQSVSKNDALKKLMDYVNYTKANSDIKFIYPHIKTKFNGETTITIPEDYKHYKGAKLKKFLESNDVKYFKDSPKKGKKGKGGLPRKRGPRKRI